MKALSKQILSLILIITVTAIGTACTQAKPISTPNPIADSTDDSSYGEWFSSYITLNVRDESGAIKYGTGDFQRGEASVRAVVTMTEYWPDYPSCQVYLLLEGKGGKYQEKLDTSLIGKEQVAEFELGMPGEYTLSYWLADSEIWYRPDELGSCTRDNWSHLTGNKTDSDMIYAFSISVTYKLPES